MAVGWPLDGPRIPQQIHGAFSITQLGAVLLPLAGRTTPTPKAQALSGSPD